MNPQPNLLGAVGRAVQRHRAATEKAHKTRIELKAAVQRARNGGKTLEEIGEVLGITRQGVHDLLKR